MDLWQNTRQLAKLAALATWEDAPTALVLTGGAVVSVDDEANYLDRVAGANDSTLPFARVELVDADPDPSAPGRYSRVLLRLHVVCEANVVAYPADEVANPTEHGGEAIKGGTRASTQPQGKSTGRGVDEVVGRLLEALGTAASALPGRLVDSTHGMQGVVVGVGPVLAVRSPSVVKRVVEIEVYSATVARRYHAPRRLLCTGGAGQIAIAWKLPPARYDRLTTIVRRSAAGGSAPSSITAGTGVSLASALDESVTPTGLAAGTYAVSVFASYDETSSTPTTADRWSSVVSYTGIVVT